MKVTFIHHSSFLVECEDCILLFDYFRGEKVPEMSFGGILPTFPPEKTIYVFASHMHRDHFDLEILKLAEIYPDVQYVFSKDIRLSENYLIKNQIDPQVKEKICFIKFNEQIDLKGIHVETLKSTDEGVAFLVTVNGQTIYHAGDLNWWHWEGETDTFNAYQEETYKNQISKIVDRDIHTAFVVMDGRLKQQKFWGFDYFMKHVNAAHVFPMHLWKQFELIGLYKEQADAKVKTESILEVSGENQIFVLDESARGIE